MPHTNEQLVSGLLRNSGPSNFIDGPSSPLSEIDALVPAFSRIRGAFKVDEGAFIPPNEIPNYGMPTSRASLGQDSRVLSRPSGDKSVGVTDGTDLVASAFRHALPAPVDFMVQDPVPNVSAIDQFNSALDFAPEQEQPLLDEPEGFFGPDELDGLAGQLGGGQGQVAAEEELAAIEAELAANEQIGSRNRRRVQDLIFN